MHISTIHSFAYYLLKQYGIGESFTKNLAIRTFEYEKKELIKDAIDEKIDANKSVRNQLGVPFYRANAIISDYWYKFSQLGVSHKDLTEMDWGQGIDEGSASFHNIVKDMIKKLDDEYFDVKRREDSISIDDIMRDLQDVLSNGNLPNTDLSMKYLFIDEFQDSDLSQIRVACLLVKILNATLFVVGDVKQSIYRFRGANDRAFFLLKNDMNQLNIKSAIEFNLVNNYRTAKGVLNRLDTYFYTWGRQGILDYDKAVIPFNLDNGYIKMYPVDGKDELADRQIIDLVNSERDLLIKKVEDSGKEPTEKNRVVILTRSNKELNDVGRLLRKAHIPISIHRDGFFYASEAVRDFYMMVSSFMFCDEPKYVFNYLLTPYAGDIEPLDLNKMERLSGDYENLVDYMNYFLDQTSWKEYHKQLRLKPVMAVFKDMIDNEPIIDSFIALNKAKRKAEGYDDDKRDADTFTRARQYQANLEKLMEILQHNLNGDKVSLYDVYNFLKLNIATNRSETEAKVQSKDDYTSVLCMTVHKSQGLE
ncbi:MAG: UvrD-helicase domain-containing protein, partial [Methanobacteriaceae archaeon]|nr:UvrD-helicase domain-containing protein [Methanobacteriaceae archaeon]